MTDRVWLWPLRSSPLLPDAPGRFGAPRRHDVHTGVDLYCEMNTEVLACEEGHVTNIVWFTGQHAPSPNGSPSSWWNDTKAVLVESDRQVIVYGELDPSLIFVEVGHRVSRGQVLGRIGVSVLRTNKGRPMVMLHLECLRRGASEPVWWLDANQRPSELIDPTPFLTEAATSCLGLPSVPVFDLRSYHGEFVDPAAPVKESANWDVWKAL